MTYGIVVASYGYGHLAAHAIESILCQTKKFDQIWFVDDGAGDCDHIPDLYAGYGINWVFRENNLGIIENFNDMLNRVTTDYVMFLGADNWLRPDTLYQLSDHAEAMYRVVCYDIMVTGEKASDLVYVYSTQVEYKDGYWYWNRKGGHHGSMLYDAKFARSVGGYAHNGTSARTDEDLNLWNKMLKEGASVYHVSQGLLYYRRHERNFNK